MSRIKTACAAALLFSLPLMATQAGAAPVSASMALTTPYAQTLDASNGEVTQVQYRRRGPGPGAIIGGLAAGAIIGGIVASQARPYYAPPPVYYQPAPAPYYAPAPAYSDDVAYCMQRYKSYDPGSGTYVGYDGYRHPCP